MVLFLNYVHLDQNENYEFICTKRTNNYSVMMIVNQGQYEAYIIDIPFKATKKKIQMRIK